jgi:hypothetical protein
MAGAAEIDSAVRFSEAGQACFVEVVDAEILGFAHEKVIEVGAIPMGVRYLIVRAGGDEKLARPVIHGRSRSFDSGRFASFAQDDIRCLSQVVVVKGEATLEAADDFGMFALPASPLGERTHGRQIVSRTQFFEQKVGDGC